MPAPILLLFGSSARRGFTPWTDPEPFARAIRVAEPRCVVHGASPGGGGDKVADTVARMYYTELGLDPELHVHPVPVDTSLDGPWPAAGHRRNARMYRTERPTLAAGGIAGSVGSPWSSGSAGMARICARGMPDVAPCALVVFRDNGVEPCRSLKEARHQLGCLWRVGLFREDVAHAGEAVKVALDLGGEETWLAAGNAVEALRVKRPMLAPWLAPLEAMFAGRAR